MNNRKDLVCRTNAKRKAHPYCCCSAVENRTLNIRLRNDFHHKLEDIKILRNHNLMLYVCIHWHYFNKVHFLSLRTLDHSEREYEEFLLTVFTVRSCETSWTNAHAPRIVTNTTIVALGALVVTICSIETIWTFYRNERKKKYICIWYFDF